MHAPLGPAWLVWLETTSLAVAMRQWLWLYPIVEIVHIIGFVVLVGAAIMFDLRLLGLSRQVPVSRMERHLLPWARGSLMLVVPSGMLMFIAHATEMAVNPAFRLKLILLALAALNATLFHKGPFRSVSTWDQGAIAPIAARGNAVFSMVCWVAILSCGRLLAYF